jgi:DNA-binding response OmpR family regulator
MQSIYVLIAEDDPNVRNGLVDTLQSEGYVTTAASDGEQALALFSRQRFDMVVLDIMMPGRSGFDVCREIRRRDTAVPILMLTAKGEEIDKVVGLELGADDYVTKPFGVHELLARIGALLRRCGRNRTDGQSKTAARFFFGCGEVDGVEFKLRTAKATWDLSARELELIRYFHARPREVIGRDELLNAVWGMEYYGTTRTLDQHVAQLRKKVEPDPARPTVITTVHGVGYRYEGC